MFEFHLLIQNESPLNAGSFLRIGPHGKPANMNGKHTTFFKAALAAPKRVRSHKVSQSNR